MSFTVKGTAVIPDLLATPRENAEATWRSKRERDGGPALVGDELVVERVEWLAEEDVQMTATPTGPVVEADLDDGSWALLALLSLFPDAPLVTGKLPKVAYMMLPKGAIA